MSDTGKILRDTFSIQFTYINSIYCDFWKEGRRKDIVYNLWLLMND